MNKLLYVFAFFFLLSCVSSKKFNQLNGNFQDCEKTVQSMKEQNQALNVKITELQSKIDKQIKDISELTAKLNETTGNLESLKAGSSEEIARLMGKLQEAQTDLQKREDILKSAQTELEKRSLRLQELEEALKQKDDAVKQLRQKVMDALVGFNNKGLTIQEKNGRFTFRLMNNFCLKPGSGMLIPKGSRHFRTLPKFWDKTPKLMF